MVSETLRRIEQQDATGKGNSVAPALVIRSVYILRIATPAVGGSSRPIAGASPLRSHGALVGLRRRSCDATNDQLDFRALARRQ